MSPKHESDSARSHGMLDSTENAIARSEDHADAEWLDAALESVHRCAECHCYFTVDDVWPFIDVDVHTHDNRALGPVMRRAAGEGWIEQSGEFRRSFLKNHGTPRPLWRSRVYKSGGVSDAAPVPELIPGWDGKVIPEVGSALWTKLASGLDREVAGAMLGQVLVAGVTPTQMQSRLAKAWQHILESLDLAWPGFGDIRPRGGTDLFTESWERYVTHLRRLAWTRNDFWRTHLLVSKKMSEKKIKEIASKARLVHLPTTLTPGPGLWLFWHKDGTPYLVSTTAGKLPAVGENIRMVSLDGDLSVTTQVSKGACPIDQDSDVYRAVIRAAEWGRFAYRQV